MTSVVFEEQDTSSVMNAMTKHGDCFERMFSYSKEYSPNVLKSYILIITIKILDIIHLPAFY
jgi:hypothetical protein